MTCGEGDGNNQAALQATIGVRQDSTPDPADGKGRVLVGYRPIQEASAEPAWSIEYDTRARGRGCSFYS